MNAKKRIKLLFASVFGQFGKLTVDEGFDILWDGEGDLAVGDKVYKEEEKEEEIEYVDIAAGEYHVGDKIYVVGEDSTITEIREPEAEPAAEPEVVAEPEPEPMEEEPAAEPAEPVTEEPAAEPEPEFDAKAAVDELKDRFAELEGKFDALAQQVADLLALPAEEDAFSKVNQPAVKSNSVFKIQ